MENTENKKEVIFRFDGKSFLLFLFIFVLEVLIAIFVKDQFVRPYGGDILVILLMYYFVKAFVKTKPLYLIVPLFLFACFIECGQLLGLVEILGLQNNKITRVVIGSSFSWLDILCYLAGAVICYAIDRKKF